MKSVESIVNEMDGGEAIDFLIENEDGFVVSKEELNKIKAEAVRSVLNLDYDCETPTGDSAYSETSIEDYASKLEKGEL